MAKPFHCTKETPWRPGGPFMRVVHEDACEIGEQENGWPSGDIVHKRCPNCGKEWDEELPQ